DRTHLLRLHQLPAEFGVFRSKTVEFVFEGLSILRDHAAVPSVAGVVASCWSCRLCRQFSSERLSEGLKRTATEIPSDRNESHSSDSCVADDGCSSPGKWRG